MAFWRRLFGRKDFTPGPAVGMEAPGSVFMESMPWNRERIDTDFEGYVSGAMKRNGPIFAVMDARLKLFSEATFAFRGHDGRDVDTTSPELEILRTPWIGGTTGELLARMIQDADLAGNSWQTTADDDGNYGKAAKGPSKRVVRMRPDWVTMILGSHSGNPWALDTKVIGILYQPRGGTVVAGSAAVLLTPSEVCHFAPTPDPVARFRGMSWMTPIIREIEADTAAVTHKKKFFQNAAVPNMAVKFDKEVEKDDFLEFVANFKAGHEGAFNAYKTLFLMGGADVTPLTHDFRQMDFSQVIGKGESRIAAAAGVPASWVGFSEGLQGSALNTNNFSANRRRLADGTIRPLWRMAAGSLQVLVKVPAGKKLWFDETDIAFLREDSRDRADIIRVQMNAADSGIKGGFEPDAVIEAIKADDIGALLGHHTGLVSVQMQEPGSAAANPPAPGTDPKGGQTGGAQGN